MDGAVRNLVAIGVPLVRALEMASSVPARVLHTDDFGDCGLGGRADLVALEPTTLAVRAVWIEGVQLRGPEVWT
jgi:N-acetylglucosamine-6-phosphate deacetylase